MATCSTNSVPNSSSTSYQNQNNKNQISQNLDVEGQVDWCMFTQDGSVDRHHRPARKDKSGTWRACPFILGNEVCERLAFYGINTNLVLYMTTQLHQSNGSASVNVTNWSGTCYATPLIGAFLADAYLGRYRTIGIFSLIYFVGMLLLTLIVLMPSLTPPSYGSATTLELTLFNLALYLIALGTGGIKPCVPSFGADQFDDNDENEKKCKSSFFNWFYFSVNVGALISSSILVYIQQKVSWALGFGIPTLIMGVAIVSFFLGTRLYRHQRPRGSPLTRILQVIIAATRKCSIVLPSDTNLLYEISDPSINGGNKKVEHTNAFSFLDKAAIQKPHKMLRVSKWKLCTVTQVEELKTLIRLLPIWVTTVMFATIYAQMGTLFVEQGQGMDTSIGPHFKIPSTALSMFNTLSVIFWVPIYDKLIVPLVRRRTGHLNGFTQLQRMGIGLVISIVAMVAAIVVEMTRLKKAKNLNLIDPTMDTTSIPLTIFWQVPQYFFIGAAEVFTFIGELEFFYNQAPDGMKSLCSALPLITIALGNYLSSSLVTVVQSITTRNGRLGWIPNKNLNVGHLDYFFWLLFVLGIINLFIYLACAHWYNRKRSTTNVQDDLNNAT